MEVSKIDINLIEDFDLNYTIAKEVFKVEPVSASVKKQKKIRKWIEKTLVEDEAYPREVMNFIGEDVPNEDYFKFLKACHDYIKLNGTHRKQLFDKYSVDLTEEVKSAIYALLEHDGYCSNIRKVGTDAQIDVEDSVNFNRTLTLVNAYGIPEGRFAGLSFDNGTLVKQDGEYRLSGEAVNCDEDGSSIPFTVCFTDAKVDVTVFRADEQLFYDTPWDYLKSVANNILDKYILSADYLNDREKELLPLIAEISKLTPWWYIPDEFETADFPVLKSYIVKLGYTELLPIIERLENEFYNDNIKERILRKLISELNTQKYEPLWRELYNLLVESQSGYQSEADSVCPTDLLNETRNNIQKLMESHGYSGKYPDFIKKGAIRKARLADSDSYDVSYVISHEKNVTYYIHCIEEYFDEHLTVQFICGTECLRKNETEGDIYSCLFNAKGRRLFKTIAYESGRINFDGEYEADNLEQRVQFAVKIAELLKFDKNELKEIMNYDIPYWKLFFSVFFIVGGVFGIFFTIGCMLFTILLCLLDSNSDLIPFMFIDTPWWLFFLLSGSVFGIAIGIITVFNYRKYIK